MLGNHKYVVDNGEDLYNTVDKEYKAKIARMMSESFFAMNKPDDAKFISTNILSTPASSPVRIYTTPG